MSIFKPHLYKMSAYKPPLEGRDPKQHMLLDFNERTLPVSKEVQQALIDYIQDGRMQMYPSYGNIVERIAHYIGVPADQVMITNGSDQGIELIFRAVSRPGDEAIIPAPTFAMYNQCAKVEGLLVKEPHYSKEKGFPVEDVIAVVSEKTRIICIANPNNPSGVGIAREAVLQIARSAPKAAVLVDECYFEYSQQTVVDCIAEYPNVVVTRTFSKTWGIPSLRFGYLVASTENIAALLNMRGPYDINQLAVVAVGAALDYPAYTENYVKEVMQASKPLLEQFLDANNVSYWPSQANFIWAFPPNAEMLERCLVGEGILVRAKKDFAGNIGLRITLGSLEQTRGLISVLEKVMV
ncbi:MAG: histidinol-phosphate aminotransferase [Lentisphaeria bacterium]|jgi:histidinol-phosphate aminotransferase